MTPDEEGVFRLLLTSDWHWDNPKCDRGLMKEHFDEAKRLNAGIISVGDQFCAMQGRYDPRRARQGIRPEHDTKHYLDSFVDTMAEWLDPYKDHLQFVCDGNHELSIQRNCETDILGRVVDELRSNGSNVQRGAISGWIKLAFKYGKRKQDIVSKLAAYHHGHGGGGEVTKGTIQTARRAAYRGQADIVLSGHIHEAWILYLMQERATTEGATGLQPQVHVSIPTYKDEYDVLNSGYHMLNGRPPKPTGSVLMECRIKRNKATERRDVQMRFTQWVA